MEEKSNNSNLVIALIVAVMFMIALPVVFFLVKDKDRDRDHRHFRPMQQMQPVQPQQPAPQQPRVVVVPPAQPQIIVVPAPVIPKECVKDMYTRGWEDAHHRREPDALMRNNPDYRRGYCDYYSKHRPGIRIDFGIGFRL